MTALDGLRDDQIAAYRRDGVVHLPGAVDPATIERINAAVLDVLVPTGGAPGSIDEERGDGMARRLFADDPVWRDLAAATPLARLAADATGSDTIRLYFDQVFAREAGSDAELRWHQDRPYWAVDGDQVASTWLSLTASTVEGSALEFVLGSHRWNRTYRPVISRGDDRDTMNTLWDGFGDRAHAIEHQIEAFEEHPDRYDVVGYAVEPGDVLLFDYRILHRARPNRSTTRRIAVSWRWLGDDATWAWERGADPIVGPGDTTLQPGDPIRDDATFPVIFRRSAAGAGPGPT